MRVTRSFNTDDFTGAKVVLTNYLDGALADFEDNQTDAEKCIEDCISALELMSDSIFGVSVYDEYRTKFEEIKSKRKGE